jgi:putative nucleotidyltransferase with HDIG domain
MDLDRYDDVVRRLAAATRSASLYSTAHPLVQRSIGAFARACGLVLGETPELSIGFLGKEIIANEQRLPRSASQFGSFASGLQERSIERITIERGATPEDLRSLIETLAGTSTGGEVTAALASRGARHVSIGTLGLADSRRVDGAIAVARRLYKNAVETAQTVWESAQKEGAPDPKAARTIISSLSQLMTEDRASLMALTAIKKHDSYTFTHMVNVSVLTMALARSLQLDSTMVTEFGLAALMHDIGKVYTPLEILNKPDRLTPPEFEVMKRHVVDGAHILRRLPDVPPLAPLVAFEHHLRLDLTGYPEKVSPRTLNLCTMIVTVADVFDALRSHRPYRDSLASARVRALLSDERRRTFHPTLLKRFVSLVGLYPVGHLVRLNTEEIGVVTHENPQDPFRPWVKIVMDRTGTWLPEPVVVNTWERDERGEYLRDVIEPVDPDVLGVDPLTLM